jgi:hypothetical protein
MRRCENVVTRRVAGETLLVPIRGRLADMQRIFALDPVAEHVWSLLAQPQSLSALISSVLDKFEVDEAQARRDVTEFVERLEAAGLIEAA